MSFPKIFTTTIATTALLGLSSLSAHAASFNNTEISFEKDTEVTFEFLESHGYYSSDFGVVEIGQDGNIIDGTQTILLAEESRGFDLVNGDHIDDFKGTAGVTVLDPVASFVFEAGKTYSLFLDSYWSGTTARRGQVNNNPLYSTDAINQTLGYGNHQALFAQENGSAVSTQVNPSAFESDDVLLSDLFSTGIRLAWDDTGNDNDKDFNDFFVKASAQYVPTVPEPGTLLGLGLVGSLMTMARRRQQS